MATTLDDAFSRVAAQWLGYNLEDEQFVDGKNDKGMDFWFQSDTGFDIYQAKSHEFVDNGELNLERFDREGVSDLQRIKAYLLTGSLSDKSTSLKGFRHRWEHAIDSRRGTPDAEAIMVNLGLVLLGEGLTPGAQEDFDAFAKECAGEFKCRGIAVRFSVTLYNINDLIERRWRSDNRSWRDIAGNKKNHIDLYPESQDAALVKNNTSVFYARCYDLVRAYQEFGYQLFEPNVRCNISVSKVNAAIRESVQTHLGREEFRFLNNGVTVICKSFSKPTRNKPFFRIIEPGIVNGLQTVFALQDAYRKLPNDQKEHFEGTCYVLVRLLQEHSVKDVSRMVRATNTQNPMQPRNLLSNNSEQVLYERLFAEFGWFYERKQGAWEAYAADPRRWRTLPGKSRDTFQFDTGGRPKARKVDNELLGQCWLSFVGFSEEANHAKRNIFELEQWYDFVFLHSPAAHGYDLNYMFQDARDSSQPFAPQPALMLCSYLARELARNIVPTQKRNRESALARLGIAPHSPKEQIEARLATDTEYVLGQVSAGMSFAFVEFFGYLLFKALGSDVFHCGSRLLQNRSLNELRVSQNFEEVCGRIAEQQFDHDDVLAVAWWAFRHCLEELVSGAWLTEYRQARSRNRFLYSTETRARLLKVFAALNQYTERTQFARPWAVGIRPPGGILGFIRASLNQQRAAIAK